jgi:hypothetical protein
MYLLLVSSCSLYCVHVDITQSFMKGLRFYPTYYLVSISWVLAKDMRTLGQRLERLFPLARAVARASCWHWFPVSLKATQVGPHGHLHMERAALQDRATELGEMITFTGTSRQACSIFGAMSAHLPKSLTATKF